MRGLTVTLKYRPNGRFKAPSIWRGFFMDLQSKPLTLLSARSARARPREGAVGPVSSVRSSARGVGARLREGGRAAGLFNTVLCAKHEGSPGLNLWARCEWECDGSSKFGTGPRLFGLTSRVSGQSGPHLEGIRDGAPIDLLE